MVHLLQVFPCHKDTLNLMQNGLTGTTGSAETFKLGWNCIVDSTRTGSRIKGRPCQLPESSTKSNWELKKGKLANLNGRWAEGNQSGSHGLATEPVDPLRQANDCLSNQGMRQDQPRETEAFPSSWHMRSNCASKGPFQAHA